MGDPAAMGVLARMKPIPELMPGGGFFLESFWRLSSCRQIGMGEGPIPWTSLRSYVTLYELSEDDASEFEEVILAMDRVYLNSRSTQTKQATES